MGHDAEEREMYHVIIYMQVAPIGPGGADSEWALAQDGCPSSANQGAIIYYYFGKVIVNNSK